MFALAKVDKYLLNQLLSTPKSTSIQRISHEIKTFGNFPHAHALSYFCYVKSFCEDEWTKFHFDSHFRR